METGIKYDLTGENRRGEIVGYHSKPQPNFLNKSKHNIDVSGLKKATRNGTIIYNDFLEEHESRFTIGMEVEKTRFHRGAVREYELFTGFENDSSCGYEAVTHILPLLPKGFWRNKVLDMMYKAEKIIDDRYSPSDYNCGGHITIGVKDHTGHQTLNHIRKNCGIVLALFRKRLRNSYCNGNITLIDRYGRNHMNGLNSKYNVCKATENTLEFRIPSRFQSVKQMIRRYELIYEIVNFSFNNPRGSHETLLRTLFPIIKSMYNGNETKAREVLHIASAFRKTIISNKVNKFTAPFLIDNRIRLKRSHFKRGEVNRMISIREQWEVDNEVPTGQRLSSEYARMNRFYSS